MEREDCGITAEELAMELVPSNWSEAHQSLIIRILDVYADKFGI